MTPEEGNNHLQLQQDESTDLTAPETQPILIPDDEASFHEAAEAEDAELPETDYSAFTKADYAALLKELSQDSDVRKADQRVRQLKPFLTELRDRQRQESLDRFVADGGKAEDFHLKPDDHDLIIDGALKLIRDKRQRNIREQEEQRKTNLATKEALLVRLREVVERQDANRGFQDFKKIQTEWNNTGPVPQGFSQPLWASYHALVDRFFDQRSIYFDLLDLDRRKNLTAKTDLCERAEKLAEVSSVMQALRELHGLHQDWRRLGPVPKEDKDAIWAWFRTASQAVYKRRDEHAREVTERHQKNAAVKAAILEKLTALVEFESGSIKEWNARSAEITTVRQEWENAGPVDRKQGRDLTRMFWALFKKFHQKKGQFFKQLDAVRDENLRQKQALIDQVVALKESPDMAKAAEEIKELQRKWKDIGPVPDKFRNKIFDEFRAHCDFFFTRMRDTRQEAGRQLDENARLRREIIARISGLSGSDHESAFRETVREYLSTGHVPAKDINSIRDAYEKAVDAFLETMPEEDGRREKLRLETQLMAVENDPAAGRKLMQEEQQLRRRIQQVENDLATLRNNMGFFSRSKNATQMLSEFQGNIDKLQEELNRLKSRLKMLRSMMPA